MIHCLGRELTTDSDRVIVFYSCLVKHFWDFRYTNYQQVHSCKNEEN